ncbi:phage virion morphogenesis protein [Gilliamella sp. B14384H2]|uniref:phage virion morphogenesis protein n=1 Tax=unclassified Gilliamella TaxID=2685620 RepID=UPI0018DBD03D|nr:phage virion morphogenesis protein [Gilliamella sp. B14384G10]MBI0040663.1 phage virion morphogenesis protein [Gilliamella sp. B14384G7]MBI0050720.1 phage virion morphogenesis protein [Gilliamella sp. B14384G13]MBI0053012.1 phage virion morphogenesis protein [Gilliamella sp. B14384H2]
MGFEALAEAARTYDKTSIGEKMTGVNIEFNIQDALDAVIAIESSLDNTTELFNHIGEVLLDIHAERFNAQESPDGIPWQELSPWYKESKPKQKDKILTLDGTLRSTLRWQIEGNTLLFGTNLIYGAIHQFGGTIKPVRGNALNVGGHPVKQVVIPARPWLGVSTQDKLLLVDVVREHLGFA